MTNYASGTYTLFVPETATVDVNAIVTFNLASAAATFNISSNTGASVTVNNTLDVVNTINLDTNGGVISLGTFIGALSTINVTIDGGGTFTAGGTAIGLLNGGSLTYSTGGGTAVFGTASDFINLSFAPIIQNFAGPSDIVDDRSLSLSGFTSYTISGSPTGTQTVSIADSAGNFSFEVSNAGLTNNTYTTLTGGPLTLVSDGSGGTDIAACFLAGTRIRTPDGEVDVENLKIGDIVATASGDSVAVRWIGVRTVATLFADVHRLMPVRIQTGALAHNVPARDLLVSPDHAMFVNGTLVHAGALVNGSTITRETNMPPRFTYYHVEVADHALILAENAPAETFVDNVDRMAFDNWAEHQALYGEGPSVSEMSYPRAKSARQVPASIREALYARAVAVAGTAIRA